MPFSGTKIRGEKLDAVLFLWSEGDKRLLDPSMVDSVEEVTG